MEERFFRFDANLSYYRVVGPPPRRKGDIYVFENVVAYR